MNKNSFYTDYLNSFKVLGMIFLLILLRLLTSKYLKNIAEQLVKKFRKLGHFKLGLVSEIFYENVYFYEATKSQKVIDVGAEIGLYTLKAAREAADGLIVSIEPNPLNFYLLLLNIKVNRLRNVVPINVAVSDFNGIAKLYLNSSSLVFRGSKYIRVPVLTLDKIVYEKLKLSTVDLIKIDVEGNEFAVLKGAEKTLNQAKKLAIAAYHYKGEAKKISDFLSKRNFRVTNRGGFVYAEKDILPELLDDPKKEV
jgi:FkbM family methyltransferase